MRGRRAGFVLGILASDLWAQTPASPFLSFIVDAPLLALTEVRVLHGTSKDGIGDDSGQRMDSVRGRVGSR